MIKTRKNKERVEVFDIIRRRWIKLTPEEWVRQHFVEWLVETKNYPVTRIANEVTIKVNSCTKRCDTIVYGASLQPLVIVEYKAQSVSITQEVFDQVAVYNMKLNVPYMIICNGVDIHFCKIDLQNNCYVPVGEIPEYSSL